MQKGMFYLQVCAIQIFCLNYIKFSYKKSKQSEKITRPISQLLQNLHFNTVLQRINIIVITIIAVVIFVIIITW